MIDKETEYELEKEQAELLRQWEAEQLEADVVYRNIGYRHFVSSSKGRRNGKQRRRRHLKEVELFRYQTGWHYPRWIGFDEIATELKGHQCDDGDRLENYARHVCGRDAGSMTPKGVK